MELEDSKGKRLSEELLPDYTVVDADDSSFYSRKDGVGVITAHWDNYSLWRTMKVCADKSNANGKLFWGKDCIKRAKKYLES
jgi:hypothetical protein